jgi:hypothetical protein
MKRTGRTIPYRSERRNELKAEGHFRGLREERRERMDALGLEPFKLVDRKKQFNEMVERERMRRIGRAKIKAESRRGATVGSPMFRHSMGQ